MAAVGLHCQYVIAVDFSGAGRNLASDAIVVVGDELDSGVKREGRC
jgi:hypothetical protein